MSDIEKYIGESKIQGNPHKKLNLKLAEGAVTTPKIADGAITSSKLAPDVFDDIVVACAEYMDSPEAIQNALAEIKDAIGMTPDSNGVIDSLYDMIQFFNGVHEGLTIQQIMSDTQGSVPFSITANSDKAIFAVGNTEQNLGLATSSMAGLMSPAEKRYITNLLEEEVLEEALPITLSMSGGTNLWYGETLNTTITLALNLQPGYSLVSNTLSLRRGSGDIIPTNNAVSKSMTISETATSSFTVYGSCTDLVISKDETQITVPDARITGTKQVNCTSTYKIFTVWTQDTLVNITSGNITPTNATLVNTGKSSNTKILYDTTNTISGEASLLILIPQAYAAPSNWTMNGYGAAVTLLAQNVTLSSTFKSQFGNVGMDKYRVYGLGTSTELITYPANTNLKIQAS